MLNVILVVVGLILLTILIVWLIDRFVPKGIKPIIHIVLWAAIIYLGYLTFDSVYGEIKFNELKTERYKVVIKKLKDIRDAELAHRTVTGEFNGDFDNLIRFVDTAHYTIVERRDSTVVDAELTKRFGGVETTRDIVILDTLGTVPVKDSLFGADTRYKTMMNLPENIGPEGAKFELNAGRLSGSGIPVFEAFVKKSVVLYDQNKNLIAKEEEVMSVDGVRGPTIKVGAMDEVYTKGNWPKNLAQD
ncbi:hypothetical protein ESY86_03360 [Subsaximicrobium wynnwilliamsii]|uniref:Uncharacterized protein n=1 Tax=Subsaximicrobium wynnwilliamsii TaxID=291179 RepID=A0A5C6ZJD5_9FLAO|nr:hypothetical protein [Subsaximicrobium wynnwilliamsii]TXD84747.1 hypothetical protein ESY87_03140 [Subsaximicrobium wynnwilliamsii]TXD90418.1 hypothetical protein ESY86_03360 [Subsaximicrobium wynnwilliamsii]TXE04894.1 hypothetical protein ESY88_01670 [Subsaximicrobium wynnwilliamsii]